MSVPAEAMELEAPIRVRRCELRRDTGGPGQWRGGLGLLKEFEILDDVRGPVSFSHRGERHFHPAGGAQGGAPGRLAESRIVHGSGAVETIPSKIVTTLRPGDRVIVGTAGGGGWGAPVTRDPQALAEDIANGKVGEDAVSRDWRDAGPGEEPC